MSVKDPIRAGDGDERHGTIGGYTNHGCRCPECTEARRSNQQSYREALRSEPIPAHVHGTTNGYQNYGCRCGGCTDASTEAKRRERVA